MGGGGAEINEEPRGAFGMGAKEGYQVPELEQLIASDETSTAEPENEQTTDQSSRGMAYLESLLKWDDTGFGIGIGSFAVGALSGFSALSNTINNGSMRGGEVALSSFSASAIALSFFAFKEYITDKKALHAARRLKAETLLAIDLREDSED